MSNKPILFAHPLSPFSRKARLVLLFQGIDHEYRMTAPHTDDAEFKAASPLGKIPAFKDDKVCVSDSSVIAHYLNRFHPGRKLIPETPAEFVQTLWYEEYADTVLMPVIGGHLFAEVVLAERLFKRKPIQSDIDKAINQELPAIYAFLDGRLAGRQWLVGNEPNLADIAVGGMLVTLYHCGQSVPDSAPNLQTFVKRFFALEPVKQVLAQEMQVMQAIKYDSPLARRAA
jgi:glutathione S-transferase